jgi:hypothetical protein
LDYWIIGLLDYWIIGLLDYWKKLKNPTNKRQNKT